LMTHVDQIQLLGAHIITLLTTLAKNPHSWIFFFLMAIWIWWVSQL
jgi:hypothetical protein